MDIPSNMPHNQKQDLAFWSRVPAEDGETLSPDAEGFLPRTKRQYNVYEVDGIKIKIGNFLNDYSGTHSLKYGNWIIDQDRYPSRFYVSPESAQKKAVKAVKLLKETAHCFGENSISSSGSVGEMIPAMNPTEARFRLGSLESLIKKTRETLQRTGHLTSDAKYRLSRREYSYDLFVADTQNEVVHSFPNKTSPLRVGLSRVDKALLSRYDLSIGDRFDGENENPLTFDEIIAGLAEARKYAIELLTSVEAEATEKNIEYLLQLLQAKSLRVVKESFKAMPFLKTERSIDKSLALMAGKGITFERLLVFNVSEKYPDSSALIDSLIKMPYEWMLEVNA